MSSSRTPQLYTSGSRVRGPALKVIDRTITHLNPKVYLNGPWDRVGWVSDGYRHYWALHNTRNGKIYIEEYDGITPFKALVDDSEWEDVRDFMIENQMLIVGKDIETVISN